MVLAFPPGAAPMTVCPDLHSNPTSPLTVSPLYADAAEKKVSEKERKRKRKSCLKAELVMRMLSKRLGAEPFFSVRGMRRSRLITLTAQVLHTILSSGEQLLTSERRECPFEWARLLCSTDSFFRTIHAVTGQVNRSTVEARVR